jgi:hypothetical protein
MGIHTFDQKWTVFSSVASTMTPDEAMGARYCLDGFFARSFAASRCFCSVGSVALA